MYIQYGHAMQKFLFLLRFDNRRRSVSSHASIIVGLMPIGLISLAVQKFTDAQRNFGIFFHQFNPMSLNCHVEIKCQLVIPFVAIIHGYYIGIRFVVKSHHDRMTSVQDRFQHLFVGHSDFFPVHFQSAVVCHANSLLF